MMSLIYELENNEALLLMYLADELPPDDRAEVEQMLSSDDRLRTELEQIRSATAGSVDALAILDGLEPINGSAESIALRGASRAIKQWKIDRLRVQPVEKVATYWRYPMWVYPTSAVASVLLGVLVWWGVSSPEYGGPTANNNSSRYVDQSFVDANLWGATDSNATLLVDSITSDLTGLTDAETQANSLVSHTDDPASSFFLNEPAQ